MRILGIIASAAPETGGPIEGVLRMSEIIRKQGHGHELLTLDPPDAPFLRTLPIRVHAMGRGRPAARSAPDRLWRYLRYSPDALRWARAHVRDYDAVVVNGLWNYATHVARRVLPGSGVPYAVYSHGMLDPWFRRTYPVKDLAKRAWWPFNEGVLYAHAAAAAFTCEEERRLAHRSYLPWAARERVVAYGTAEPPARTAAQDAAFAAAAPALGTRPFLLFLGRIHEKKGCDLLVAAFARVAEAHGTFDLVIAGPDQAGLAATLRAQAARAGIADRLHWPGMLTGDAKWGAFHGCAAFVLPSHQENFGIVVAEAMACGKPVLVSDRVNIFREVRDAAAGIVAADTVEGTEALLRAFLALSPAERTAMGQRGRALFTARFTIAAAADDLLRLLRDAIEDRKGR